MRTEARAAEGDGMARWGRPDSGDTPVFFLLREIALCKPMDAVNA